MKHTLRIGILTPYLNGNALKRADEEHVQKYKAQDIRTSLADFVEDQGGIFQKSSSPNIILDMRTKDEQNKIFDVLQQSDLAVVSCTSEAERDTSIFSQTGLFMARCSVFYGHHSTYTGLTPDQSGHAFDLPKDVSIVLSFLTDPMIGNALISRKYGSICEAVENLNSNISQPVIITPYLKSACRISYKKQQKNMSETIQWYSQSCKLHKSMKAFENVMQRDPLFAEIVKGTLSEKFNDE